MLSLLMANFFQKNLLLIVLTLCLALLMFLSFNRRKREEANRLKLNEAIVPGVKVKTYSGVYGKVVSIQETTDGKIVLLETGEGNKVSYQNIHINAIYGLDEKQPIVLDAEGNEVFPDLDKLEAERLAKKEEEKAEKTEQKKRTTKTNKE